MGKKEDINKIINEIEQNKESKSETSSIIKEFLIINIDSNLFAVQIEYLREIIDVVEKNNIISIPYTPSYILGIINIRGEIIPALSILDILGIKFSENSYNKLAIIDERFKIAVPFNEIIDLKIVDVKNIKSIKDATKSSKENFLAQEFGYKGQIIRIIDILKLYSSEFLL